MHELTLTLRWSEGVDAEAQVFGMWKAGQLNAHPWFPNICFSKLLNPTDLDILLPCVAPPINRFFLETLLIRKTQFLDSTLKFFPNKKRSNCDYAQPTWLFAHHLVMKHSKLSLTTLYHPVNDDRSKSKHGQHPKPFNMFNTCWWFVGWGCHYQR